MSLFYVTVGSAPQTSDVNQFSDVFAGKHDIGAVRFAPVLDAPPLTGFSLAAQAGTSRGAGTSSYEFTYVTGTYRTDGTFQKTGESLPSSPLSITTLSGSTTVKVTIPTSLPTSVAAINIYRTTVGGSAYKFLTTIKAGNASYTDSTLDGSLGAAPPSTNTTGTYFAEDLNLGGNSIMSASAIGFGTTVNYLGAPADPTLSTNFDHIWFDDTTNTYHFVSDDAYHATGNGTLHAGMLDLQHVGGQMLSLIQSDYVAGTNSAYNYIGFDDANGAFYGYVGYASSKDGHLRLNNTIGDVLLQPKSGGYVDLVSNPMKGVSSLNFSNASSVVFDQYGNITSAGTTSSNWNVQDKNAIQVLKAYTDGTKKLTSAANTIDDGSGNMTVAGNLTLGTAAIHSLQWNVGRTNMSSIYWNASTTADYGMLFKVDGSASVLSLFSTGKVTTTNNTLDDGAGNLIVSGIATLGKANVLGAADANTISSSGLFYINGSGTNVPTPTASGFAYYIIHIDYGDGQGAYQMAFKSSVNPDTYVRRKTSGAWQAWVQQIRDDGAGNALLPANLKMTATDGTSKTVIQTGAKDSNGYGVSIGGGGLTVIGAGESHTAMFNSQSADYGIEQMYVTSDNNVYIVTNLQSGVGTGELTWTFGEDGVLTTPGNVTANDGYHKSYSTTVNTGNFYGYQQMPQVAVSGYGMYIGQKQNIKTNAAAYIDMANWSCDKVWYYNGSTYTDMTSSANTSTPTTTPWTVLAATTNYVYFGDTAQFSALYFDLQTMGAGITLSADYWNGTAWVGLTFTDGTNKLGQDGWINWAFPANWATTTVSDATARFYVRFKTTTTPSTVPTANYANISIFTGSFLYCNNANVNVANINYAGDFTGRTYKSTVAVGTAPLIVTSTTAVTNLNADMVDGYHFDQSLKKADKPTFAGLTLTGDYTNASQYYLEANCGASGTATLPASTNYVIPFAATNGATGISSGTFTAPSAGRYLFLPSAYLAMAATSSVTLTLFLNGAAMTTYGSSNNTGAGVITESMHAPMIVNLSANDTVYFALNTAASTTTLDKYHSMLRIYKLS